MKCFNGSPGRARRDLGTFNGSAAYHVDGVILLQVKPAVHFKVTGDASRLWRAAFNFWVGKSDVEMNRMPGEPAESIYSQPILLTGPQEM